MSIHVDCPVCGHHFIRPDGLAGMSEKCPRCREVLIVPGTNSHFRPPVAGQTNRYRPSAAPARPAPPLEPASPEPASPPAPDIRPAAAQPPATPPSPSVAPSAPSPPAPPLSPERPVARPAEPSSDLEFGIDDVELLP